MNNRSFLFYWLFIVKCVLAHRVSLLLIVGFFVVLLSEFGAVLIMAWSIHRFVNAFASGRIPFALSLLCNDIVQSLNTVIFFCDCFLNGFFILYELFLMLDLQLLKSLLIEGFHFLDLLLCELVYLPLWWPLGLSLLR